MNPKLTFALQNNKLVNVSEVSRGLECNCFCPNPKCNSRLIAKKGDVNRDHFAHYDQDACIGAIESALHILAKNIIEKEKKIKIPELLYFDKKYSKSMVALSVSKTLNVDLVELEISQDNIRPDLILHIGKKRLFIEIAVTHKVDEEKKKKIEKLGISTIEIDLAFYQSEYRIDEIKELIINSDSNKEWIYNSQLSNLISTYNKTKEKEIQEVNRKIQELKKNTINNNFRIIEENEHKGFYCPKLMKNEAMKSTLNDPIIELIRKSENWDGLIYTLHNGSKFVIINGKQIYCCPSLKEQKRNPDNIETYQLVNSLVRISRESHIQFNYCEKCEFFNGYIVENEMVSCKFK